MLGCTIRQGKIEISINREIRLSLPATRSFSQADLVRDRSPDVLTVEK